MDAQGKWPLKQSLHAVIFDSPCFCVIQLTACITRTPVLAATVKRLRHCCQLGEDDYYSRLVLYTQGKAVLYLQYTMQ